MAVDVACIIALDGYTIRVSNNGIRRSDGGTIYPFIDTLMSPSDLNALGPLDQALQYPATFSVTIDNSKGWLDDYLPGGSSAERWDNRRVDVYTGGSEGSAISAMSHVFSGLIPIGGMSIERTQVILKLKDLRDGQNVSFGGGVISSAIYPNAPEASLGQAIPWAIGDFSELSDGDALRTVLVDTVAGTFKVSSTPMVSGSVTVYEYNSSSWSDITGTVTLGAANLNAGQFVYAGYNADYEYRVAASFYDSSTTPAGPASFHPVDVGEWILTDIASVAVGDINSVSFATAKTAGDAFTVRRYESRSMSVFEELNRLFFEGGYDLYMLDAEYYLKWFAPISTTTTELGSHSFIDGSFSTSIDPDRLYANKVSVSYDWQAGAIKKLIEEDTTEQSAFGRVVESNKVYYWLFDQADVQLSIQRKLFFWKRLPEVATFQCAFIDESSPIYSVWLEDSVRVTFWRFTNADFWVRKVRRNWLNGLIDFEAINLQTIANIGVWDSDPSGTVSNPGHWADATGGGVPVVSYWW